MRVLHAAVYAASLASLAVAMRGAEAQVLPASPGASVTADAAGAGGLRDSASVPVVLVRSVVYRDSSVSPFAAPAQLHVRAAGRVHAVSSRRRRGTVAGAVIGAGVGTAFVVANPQIYRQCASEFGTGAGVCRLGQALPIVIGTGVGALVGYLIDE